ncbi:MAG TPA: glycoside hydrolase family 88 protein [Pirellulales bacterium]|jgi:rhamnogalacturonyl hydrolase YesR|nr:glycoside hydrolase family 88 protein [Pirellulales bacterium]
MHDDRFQFPMMFAAWLERLCRRALYVLCAALLVGHCAHADEPASPLDALRLPKLIHSAIGVTRAGQAIPCVTHEEDLDLHTKKCRVLLVAGLDGADASIKSAIDYARWFYTDAAAAEHRQRYLVSLVAVGPGAAGAEYPPGDEFYTSPNHPDAQYLWRWIGMHAPDLVIELDAQPSTGGFVGPHWLSSAVDQSAPCMTGAISGRKVALPTENLNELLSREVASADVSPARRELQHRLDRSATQVATQLSVVYGHELKTVQYIPAVALVGRVRLGTLTGDAAQLADVERIVAPFREGRPTISKSPSGSDIAGRLIFGTLAEATGDKRYIALVKQAADLAFDADGKPRESMPAHSEMSDAVFMACPVLAQAGKLTGEPKYFAICLRHLRFMNRLDLRSDGLYRHSPLCEAAWGRGNGFPALGLTLVLGDMPADCPERAEVLAVHRAHLDALLKHQDTTGCWHEVIDHPESYRELTATCMITMALARGVRFGWLEGDRYRKALERGWYAIRTRTADDGTLVDVCASTGKQKSLRDYYDRPAILGRDPRGGAMSLLAAIEMIEYERYRQGTK